jgi:putative redox protein
VAVEMDVVYEGNLLCSATHGPSGQVITTDAPVDNGGTGSAFSPTDLVGAALAACMATIMGLYAKRTGLDIDGARLRVAKEMTQTPPRRIAKFRVIVTLPQGKAFTAEQRAELENAAALCPVKRSLHPDVHIEMEFVYPD